MARIEAVGFGPGTLGGLWLVAVSDETGTPASTGQLSAEDANALDRQQQIWTALYGPQTAADMVSQAVAARRDDPDTDLATILRSVDPEDDDDIAEAGTMRPGPGF